MRAKLIYYFEILLWLPGVYYLPAIETQNTAVIIFFVIANITGVVSVCKAVDAIKEFCNRKPMR